MSLLDCLLAAVVVLMLLVACGVEELRFALADLRLQLNRQRVPVSVEVERERHTVRGAVDDWLIDWLYECYQLPAREPGRRVA